MPTAEAALDRLRDPAAKVSAHYLIDEDGQTFRLVDEDKRAWHAGVARWAGAGDVNARSIGIETANPGHEWGYLSFTDVQMAAVIELAGPILHRHSIPGHRVLGHSDVAPARRQDPGELFDWQQLAAAGIGIVANHSTCQARGTPVGPGDRGPVVEQLQSDLARFGYEVPKTGVYNQTTTAVVRAFQRHFRPDRIDGVADAQCQAALGDLLAQIAAKT